jgi:hypothetical protein
MSNATAAVIRRLTLLLPLSALLGYAGCNPPSGDPFHVQATLSSETCGSGAVEPEDEWEFDIRLERDDSVLTWYDESSGTESRGRIDDDDEFSVSESGSYTLTEATTTSNGCTVRRHVRYSGDIDFDGESEIQSLDGTIVLEYSEATGYDCDELIGSSDGFDDLPCKVTYEFTADPK